MQDLDNDKLKGNVCFDFLMSGTCHIPLQKPFLSVTFFLICLGCFFFSWFALKLAKPEGQKIKIVESKYTPSDLMNYVLPYIVSFMSISYIETNKFFGFVIFLLWLFWLSYKSGQIILNPMLIVFNWKMYEVSYRFPGSDDIFSGVVLANTDVNPNSDYEYETIQSVIVICGDDDNA
jgi:hypothetical protein